MSDILEDLDLFGWLLIALVLGTIAVSILRYIALLIPDNYIEIADACILVLVLLDVVLVLKVMKKITK